MKVQDMLSSLKQRKYILIYLLHGEEAHYIDEICAVIENTVLNDSQKGFDQTILYGKDVDFSTIISAANRYPMMSDYQVILVKEAQGLKWKGEEDVEMLRKYVENPTPTTILVFAYKYSKFDKRTKLYKSIEKAGVAFE